MVRPTKKRRVANIPDIKFFKPAGVRKHELEEVVLSLEEVEAIRLKDKKKLTQQQAAEKMEVSRPTFQRILTEARQKIADALLSGKALKFAGGDYDFKPRCPQCGDDVKTKQGRNGRRSGKQAESCPRCDE
jgi:predicted DNA-binding protein (UPF0251 family)